MCMNSEAVEALHALTSELKAEHERMREWLGHFDQPAEGNENVTHDHLEVTRAEAERIFADRIAAHEARIKDLGWERKIRVESPTAGSGGGSNGPGESGGIIHVTTKAI